MAIFSTRSSKRDADEAPSRNVPIDSIETLRTRARQRLIGSVLLVALGIITFTFLFDSQPRPIPVDIPIVMPDKDKAGTFVLPTAVVASAPVEVSTPATHSTTLSPAAAAVVATQATAAVQASASLSPKEEIVTSKTDKKPDAKLDVKSDPKVELKPVVVADQKPAVKLEVKPVAKPATEESNKALSILEGREPPKVVTSNAAAATATSIVTAERFIVQFGAYAENDKAREARLKVEAAGLKTYVHVAVTPQGKRIRLRVGPFVTKDEAEKAAAKIKNLNLPAAILTL